MAGLPQDGQVEIEKCSFFIVFSSQCPLGGDKEIEMIFTSLSYKLALRIYHNAFQVRRLDHVEVFQTIPPVRIPGSEALVDCHGVDNSLSLNA